MTRPLTKRQRRALRDASKGMSGTVALPRPVANQLVKRGLAFMTLEVHEPMAWGRVTHRWPVVMLTEAGHEAANALMETK